MIGNEPTARTGRRLSVAAIYLAGIVAANVITSRVGLTPVGFSLMATAGTWGAGAVIAIRNTLQDFAGRRWVLACIVIGAALSYVLGSGRIAVASGITFLVAETLDTTVYTWLRQHGWRRAVLAGTWTGAVVDTLVFLWLAGFGLAWPIVAGQLLVKAVWVTGTYLLIREVATRAVSRQRVQSESA